MKNFYLTFVFFSLGIIFTACGEATKETTDLKIEYPEELEELDNFEAFSLKPFDINALINLPNATANIGTSVTPEVFHEMDSYFWEIQVGENFHLTIEDWGTDAAFQDHLNQLNDQDIYIVEFLEKEDNFAYYKTELNVKGKGGKDNVGVEHISFHVIAQHTIDGINYLFKTKSEGCPKPIADFMAKSVTSVEPIEVAS